MMAWRCQVLALAAGLVLASAAAAAGCPTPPREPVPSADIRCFVNCADYILVEKKARRMILLRQGWIVKVYRFSLGENPRGHKRREGDERTPEGHYRIAGGNPASPFRKFLWISYPNPMDIEDALRRGQNPGCYVGIHGTGGLSKTALRGDWTNGCLGVSNREIDEIWSLVNDGTPIEIRP